MFPIHLHGLLTDLEASGQAHIASFQPHGRSFKVHMVDEFVSTLLPNWFQQSKYASFQRQLNIYGFKRITSGPDKNAYYHKDFLRGRPTLASKITRCAVKGNGPRRPHDPFVDPNFYVMPYLTSTGSPEPPPPPPNGPPLSIHASWDEPVFFDDAVKHTGDMSNVDGATTRGSGAPQVNDHVAVRNDPFDAILRAAATATSTSSTHEQPSSTMTSTATTASRPLAAPPCLAGFNALPSQQPLRGGNHPFAAAAGGGGVGHHGLLPMTFSVRPQASLGLSNDVMRLLCPDREMNQGRFATHLYSPEDHHLYQDLYRHRTNEQERSVTATTESQIQSLLLEQRLLDTSNATRNTGFSLEQLGLPSIQRGDRFLSQQDPMLPIALSRRADAYGCDSAGTASNKSVEWLSLATNASFDPTTTAAASSSASSTARPTSAISSSVMENIMLMRRHREEQKQQQQETQLLQLLRLEQERNRSLLGDVPTQQPRQGPHKKRKVDTFP